MHDSNIWETNLNVELINSPVMNLQKFNGREVRKINCGESMGEDSKTILVG